MFTSDEASQAFASVLNLTGELAKPLIKYLGLFRSENRDLSFSCTAKIINEIAPDIVAGQIQRNRQIYPAPKQAWIWAINVMLERREQGLLQLPLKTHGYLYEVISSYKADTPQHKVQYEQYHTVYDPNTQTLSHYAKPKTYSEPSRYELETAKRQKLSDEELDKIEFQQHEREKHQPINPDVRELFSFVNKIRKNEVPALKDIPVEQLPAHLMQKRRDGESLLECYNRLKATETENQAKETNP